MSSTTITRVRAGARSAGEPAGRRRGDPRDWALWSARPRVVAYVLAVDVLAVLLAGVLAGAEPVSGPDLGRAALLALGAIAHIEVARRLERRRAVANEDRASVDLKSMWSFAGLLLVPVGLALALVVITFGWWWLRVPRRPLAHRWLFSGSTVLLGSIAAWPLVAPDVGPGVLTAGAGPTGLLLVSLAGLVRWSVNHALVVGAIRLAGPGELRRRRLSSVTDVVMGLGALAMGIVLAALVSTTPWLAPVLLVPLLTMHRGFHVQQLARAAHTDDKTGLATSAHWHVDATRALDRARRRRERLGVLMVDLDDFKAVNDTWGHLVGDRVLRAVADVLADEVRPRDRAGRFGGEEFVVLVDGADAAALTAVAERVRCRVAAVRLDVVTADGPGVLDGLSVSVGGAVYRRGATGRRRSVDDLLLAADGALYEAKGAGRDRVRLAPGA